MKKETVIKPEIKLIGLSVVTNNANEQNPQTAKIGSLVNDYFELAAATKIANRKHPGITYSVYTQYQSDEHGDYTYLIGEEVSSFADMPAEFQAITVPSSQYQRFTTHPGKMPSVVIEAWQAIWTMSAKELGGNRRYLADFEVYDQRASDPSNAVVDIYLGVE